LSFRGGTTGKRVQKVTPRDSIEEGEARLTGGSSGSSMNAHFHGERVSATGGKYGSCSKSLSGQEGRRHKDGFYAGGGERKISEADAGGAGMKRSIFHYGRTEKGGKLFSSLPGREPRKGERPSPMRRFSFIPRGED